MNAEFMNKFLPNNKDDVPSRYDIVGYTHTQINRVDAHERRTHA